MLITCPECGHEVSDKAPVCPHCGVEIANHTTNIPPEQSAKETFVVAEPMDEEVVVAEPVNADSSIGNKPYRGEEPPQYPPKVPQKKGHGTLIVSFFIAAVICATVLYFYKDAVSQRDAKMKADAERVDSIEKPEEKTTLVQTVTPENSEETTVEETLDTPEETPAEQEINTTEEKKPKSEEVKQEETAPTKAEKDKAFMAVRRLFQAINAHNASGVRANTTKTMTSFGSTYNATPDDVVNYMNNLYGEGVTNLNFYLGEPTDLQKKEVDGKTEYSISLPARKVTEHGKVKSETHHHVKAAITTDGKVKSLTIN